jgi:hypothetical protein
MQGEGVRLVTTMPLDSFFRANGEAAILLVLIAHLVIPHQSKWKLSLTRLIHMACYSWMRIPIISIHFLTVYKVCDPRCRS